MVAMLGCFEPRTKFKSEFKQLKTKRFNRRRSTASTRNIGRKARILGLLVALFHGWILWERLWDGSLFEAEIALRWGSAALVLAAGLCLYRRGLSLVRGNPARVFWLIVLLLHFLGSAPLPEAITGGLAAAGQATLELILPSVTVGILALTILSLSLSSRKHPVAISQPLHRFHKDTFPLASSGERLSRRFCRPPPA